MVSDEPQSLTDDRLKALDRRHGSDGDYVDWMLSEERAKIAGPKRKVRLLTWNNLHELCQKAGLNEQKLIAAYQEALDTDDVIFVEYEVDDALTD
jgi:hypothetical protein